MHSNHELNLRFDPQYAANFEQLSMLSQEQQIQQQQMQQSSEWVNNNQEGLIGRKPTPGIDGLPSGINNVPAIQGTGFYNPSGIPSRKFLAERNLLLQGSGQPELMKQGFNNSAKMQESILSGANSIDELKFNLKNAPKKDRKTIEGADGYKYYTDNQQRVLPNVQAKQANETMLKVADPNSPTGVSYVPQSQANGQAAPQTGMKLAMGADGSIEFTQGGASADMQKPTINKIEEKQLDSNEMLGRLNSISRTFNGDYLSIGSKLENKWIALQDKMNLGTLDEADKEQLEGFTRFSQTALTNLNKTLNELSGAAVSPQEFERIAASLPKVGTGIFDGDSAIEFKSKLGGAIKDTKFALARYHYAKNNGLDPLQTGIQIGDMPSLINRRGTEIEKRIQSTQTGITEDRLEELVRQQLSTEFGI